jgi:hypothetical protein
MKELVLRKTRLPNKKVISKILNSTFKIHSNYEKCDLQLRQIKAKNIHTKHT